MAIAAGPCHTHASFAGTAPEWAAMSCSWAASPSQIVAASFIDPVPGPEYMRAELVSGGNVPKFITTSARLRRYELLLKTWTLLEDIDAGVTDARSGWNPSHSVARAMAACASRSGSCSPATVRRHVGLASPDQ